MDILNFHKKLIENYKTYIQSFLNIKDPSILKFVYTEIGSKKLWAEPIVQFNHTFEKGKLGRIRQLQPKIKLTFDGYESCLHIKRVIETESKKMFLKPNGLKNKTNS